ncbi:MAG: histidine kinase, partial [Bacteroidota bacterium]
GFFLAGAIILTRNFLIRVSILKSIFLHFILSVAFTFLSYSLLIPFENLFLSQPVNLTLDSIFVRSMYGANFSFFLYFAIISILYAALYLTKEQNQILGAERLKNQLLDAKMSSLRTQIQPHFLFNTLNSISYLTGTDVKKSKDAIADLSQILRYTLAIKTNNYVFLEDEYNCAFKYLSLMKIRFDDKLNFNFDSLETDKKYKVPPFVLQPILENSLKHGLSKNQESIEINIYSKIIADRLSILVTNDGELLPSNFHYGTGLGNILLRLNELFGDKYGFVMKNDDNLVKTKISIPLRA